MVKVKKQFRFDEETVHMLDTLIPFVSSELGVRMDRTKMLEKLVKDAYDRLLDNGVLILSEVPNDSDGS